MASAAAAASDHSVQIAALCTEIAELRLSLSAAANAESIVASLTEDNSSLVKATNALKNRVAELEELVEMSRV